MNGNFGLKTLACKDQLCLKLTNQIIFESDYRTGIAWRRDPGQSPGFISQRLISHMKKYRTLPPKSGLLGLWHRIMHQAMTIIVAALFSCIFTVSMSSAEDVPEITPEMIEAADAGDGYSAYITGYNLLIKGGEENI